MLSDIGLNLFDALCKNPHITILAAVVTALAFFSELVRSRRRVKIVAKNILTANEREFFYRLKRALPDYHIFPQVAFGAILDTPYDTGRRYYRGRFSQKIADYVVCERLTMNIIAIVELDDRTHNLAKDRKRDAMLNNAGYRVVRFQSKSKPSESAIANYFNCSQ
jgi:hypothetical protein